jgi:hypothetical protein
MCFWFLCTLTQCLQMSVRPSASEALVSGGGASTRSLCPYGVRHQSTNRRFVPSSSCSTKEDEDRRRGRVKVRRYKGVR